MLDRIQRASVEARLAAFPVVAILGPRQVGKTTLSQQITWSGPVTRFDLQYPPDRARLADPVLALEGLEGLVVLDEVQEMPELFPLLRVLADRGRARFLLLGSASPHLVQGASESLAGRITFVELGGFSLDEVEDATALWVRGGFPRSYLARTDAESATWRQEFVRTFLERDLPSLGVGVAATTMRRLWTMLAHRHGQVLNLSELSRGFGFSDTTVRSYVDTLAHTYMLRVLLPWHENVGKRQVKRPKVYLRDSGLVHTLLGLADRVQVESHPILGASWEGFALEQVLARQQVDPEHAFFWATHSGAELDLLVVRHGRKVGYEFKRTSTPKVTRSMRSAQETLGLDALHVVVPGGRTFPLAQGIDVVGIEGLDALS